MTDSSWEECTAPAEHHKYGEMIGVANDATHKGRCIVGSSWTGRKVAVDGLEPRKLYTVRFVAWYGK